MKTAWIGIMETASVSFAVKDIGMTVKRIFANFQIPHVLCFRMTQDNAQLAPNVMP